MDYHVKTFEQLTTAELLLIMQERIAVFVVEQQCPYQEIDELDCQAWHTWLQEGTALVGYTRIIAAEDSVRIGRVLTTKAYRGAGHGETLLQKTLAVIKEEFAGRRIVLGAQEYAIGFYQKFGFEIISEKYLEDGIPHVEMQLDPLDHSENRKTFIGTD